MDLSPSISLSLTSHCRSEPIPRQFPNFTLSLFVQRVEDALSSPLTYRPHYYDRSDLFAPADSPTGLKLAQLSSHPIERDPVTGLPVLRGHSPACNVDLDNNPVTRQPLSQRYSSLAVRSSSTITLALPYAQTCPATKELPAASRRVLTNPLQAALGVTRGPEPGLMGALNRATASIADTYIDVANAVPATSSIPTIARVSLASDVVMGTTVDVDLIQQSRFLAHLHLVPQTKNPHLDVHAVALPHPNVELSLRATHCDSNGPRQFALSSTVATQAVTGRLVSLTFPKLLLYILFLIILIVWAV